MIFWCFFQQNNLTCHKAKTISSWWLNRTNGFHSHRVSIQQSMFGAWRNGRFISRMQSWQICNNCDANMSRRTKFSEECFQHFAEKLKKMVSCNIKNWFKKNLISICLELDQFLLRSLRCILHVRAIRFRSESKNELIKVLAICKPFYILIETTMNYYYQPNEMESVWLGYQKRNGHHDSALAGSIVSHQMVSYTNQPEEACHCLHIRSHDFWQENLVYHFIFVTY